MPTLPLPDIVRPEVSKEGLQREQTSNLRANAPLRLFLTDLCAATFSTVLMFGLGYIFARQIEDGVKEAQHWVTIALAVGLSTWLLLRFYKARKRRGQLVGPPVLVTNEPEISTPTMPALAPEAGPKVVAEIAPPSTPLHFDTVEVVEPSLPEPCENGLA